MFTNNGMFLAATLLSFALYGCVEQVAESGPPSDSGSQAEALKFEDAEFKGAVAEERLVVEDSDQEFTDLPGADPVWKSWPEPQAVLFLTGEQRGYIEPCGCTGLENQKGGLARRHTFLREVRETGWNVVPLDVGNQVRRFGQQAGIKFQTTISSLKSLGYRVVGIGPDDLKLDVGLLLSEAASEPSAAMQFVSANVTLLDPELLPRVRVMEIGGRKIGVTAILDPATIKQKLGEEIVIEEAVQSVTAAAKELKRLGCDFRVLLYYGGNDANEDVAKLVAQIDEFDLVVAANEFGEPVFEPESVEGSKAKLVLTGHKGMYACLVGLYDDPKTPIRYARVALTHEFADSEEMLQSLDSYQQHLKSIGLERLGLKPVPHPSGNKFVGTSKCGECHTTAMEIWEGTPHAHATDSLVHPPNDRGAIARHFDPECLSCHSTGWNPQAFYPYLSGYLSLEGTPELVANGCENCHGPGSKHVAAEEGDIDADEEMLARLRDSMRLPYEKAKEHCMECHDLDNSPDFHQDGAFEKYWEQVKHVGLD